MKLNPLPPSLRPKHRYLVFEVIADKPVELAEIVQAIWETAHRLFGEAGTAEFELWIPGNLYDRTKGRGLVRCTHDSVEKVRLVLASVRTAPTQQTVLKILGVTGTIKSAKRKYFGITTLGEFAGKSEIE